MARIDDIAEAIARLEGFYTQGTIPQRLNNPGNLRVWGGYPTEDTGKSGKFVRFPTTEEGWNALKSQTDMNIKRGLTTNEFFAGKKGVYEGYAPKPENNPEKYAAAVAQKLGISPDIPLNQEAMPGATLQEASPDVIPLDQAFPDPEIREKVRQQFMVGAPRGGSISPDQMPSTNLPIDPTKNRAVNPIYQHKEMPDKGTVLGQVVAPTVGGPGLGLAGRVIGSKFGKVGSAVGGGVLGSVGGAGAEAVRQADAGEALNWNEIRNQGLLQGAANLTPEAIMALKWGKGIISKIAGSLGHEIPPMIPNVPRGNVQMPTQTPAPPPPQAPVQATPKVVQPLPSVGGYPLRRPGAPQPTQGTAGPAPVGGPYGPMLGTPNAPSGGYGPLYGQTGAAGQVAKAGTSPAGSAGGVAPASNSQGTPSNMNQTPTGNIAPPQVPSFPQVPSTSNPDLWKRIFGFGASAAAGGAGPIFHRIRRPDGSIVYSQER